MSAQYKGEYMLYTRYNENGSEAFCEKSQLVELEKMGYKYDKNPNGNSIIEEKVKTKIEKKPEEPVKEVQNTTRTNRRNKKDIILE